MATAKKGKSPDAEIQRLAKNAPAKVIDPNYVDEIKIVDVSELEDPDCGLAKMYYNFVMYGDPVTQELADIINDPAKLKEFQLTHEFNMEDE